MLAALPDDELLEAASIDEALAVVEKVSPDLLLLDIRLSDDPRDRGGLEILRRVRASGRQTPAVMVTSMSEFAEVREAMRLGAQDYVPKDELCPEMLLPIVEGLRERHELKGEVVRLREKVDRTWGTRAIVGSSPAMERVRRLVERVAESSSTVLIRGETGTGKEMVARALHETSSRRGEPFLAVNCSALPGTLIESLIFGHERGAFTGAERRMRGQLELAGAGTHPPRRDRRDAHRAPGQAPPRARGPPLPPPRRRGRAAAPRPHPRRDPRRPRAAHRPGPLPGGPLLPPQRGDRARSPRSPSAARTCSSCSPPSRRTPRASCASPTTPSPG